MRAVADLLQQGEGDLTYRRLSAATGVPERTLFRYYPTKSALMSAFWTWLNAKLQMPAPAHAPAELVDQVPQLFAAFEADASLVRAMLHDPNGRDTRLAHAPERRARLRAALQPLVDTLAPDEQIDLLASVQLLASAAGWESMKDNWELSGERAARAAQWAVAALLAAAAASATPGREED